MDQYAESSMGAIEPARQSSLGPSDRTRLARLPRHPLPARRESIRDGGTDVATTARDEHSLSQGASHSSTSGMSMFSASSFTGQERRQILERGRNHPTVFELAERPAWARTAARGRASPPASCGPSPASAWPIDVEQVVDGSQQRCISKPNAAPMPEKVRETSAPTRARIPRRCPGNSSAGSGGWSCIRCC